MSRHQHARGQRIGFAEAPEQIRQWVADRLDSDVASVVDCVGGMSPGPAARLRTASGTTAFVKACGPELNPMTPELLRSEARLLAGFPIHRSLPRLLETYDDGDWVAMLLEDLPGELPAVPWSAGDLERATALLSRLRPVLDGINVEWLEPGSESPMFSSAWKLLAERLDRFDPWWAKHHDELVGHASRASGLIDGKALLHWDVRADNLIFGADRDVLVDWGQARRGAPWVDHALLAMDCAMSGSDASAMDFFVQEPALADRDPSDLVAMMAAVAMTLQARSMDDPPPGLPTMPATRGRWAENLRRELDAVL